MPKKRDYKREYQLAKERGDKERDKIVAAHLTPEQYDAFKRKASENGTKVGTLLREWIEDYLNN